MRLDTRAFGLTPRTRRPLAMIGILIVTECGGSDISPSPITTELLTVVPAGGSTGVSTASGVTITFSSPMMTGMEQYLDFHLGDAAGPLVPIMCSWSADRETVTCTPSQPLAPNTRYTIHMGGGMMDADDHPVDLRAHMAGSGGEWFMPTMMHGIHGGTPVSGMGPGWRGMNGSYGMLFSFTTG